MVQTHHLPFSFTAVIRIVCTAVCNSRAIRLYCQKAMIHVGFREFKRQSSWGPCLPQRSARVNWNRPDKAIIIPIVNRNNMQPLLVSQRN